ncbi:MAG: orotidine-5'-phosphate decarboxylase [Bacteroidia bacterium]|nr:orotidine-5'-phosphate decarboxylase [Bacteroidia bacterium]MDW8333191.1 orotidine-5'-phosphate decarboxylase [Bacteroidia bacterium]
MSASALEKRIRPPGGCVCVGLDLEPALVPPNLGPKTFLHQLLSVLNDATAFKINFAFFERFWGEDAMRETVAFAKKHGVYLIADAKRCDVEHSAEHYAARIFDELGFDAVTVSPYLGVDSILPFLNRRDKLTFVLALSSNPGADDFQFHPYTSLEQALKARSDCSLVSPLFVKVVQKLYERAQNLPGDVGFVAGATRPEALAWVRELAPDAFILVPGVGAQGGNVETVMQQASGRILVNVGRDVVYAYRRFSIGDVPQSHASSPEAYAAFIQWQNYAQKTLSFIGSTQRTNDRK